MSPTISKLQRLALVSEAFTPSAPVDRFALFSGRQSQIGDVVGAVAQRGLHVALYGERGVGKTSLANVLADLYGNGLVGGTPLAIASTNCNTNDSFDSVWGTILRELGLDPPGELTPEAVRFALGRDAPPSLVVIDELDRLEDDEALTLLADTVKTLSDHSTHTTLILVGVADSVEQLIGDHRSVERALLQVEMPRMSLTELREIIRKGCDHAQLRIETSEETRLARLSEGLPHYTHLLGLHAAQSVVNDDRDEITPMDIDNAIGLAVEKHTIRSEYQTAVRSPKRDSLFAEVLLGCALAPKRELGYFPAGAVKEPLSWIRRRPVTIASYVRHLNKFTQPARGPVLQQVGQERSFFYRFASPIMQPYVILNGLSEGMITDQDLWHIQRVAEDEFIDDPPIEPERLF